jgi:hypothetical protein
MRELIRGLLIGPCDSLRTHRLCRYGGPARPVTKFATTWGRQSFRSRRPHRASQTPSGSSTALSGCEPQISLFQGPTAPTLMFPAPFGLGTPPANWASDRSFAMVPSGTTETAASCWMGGRGPNIPIQAVQAILRLWKATLRGPSSTLRAQAAPPGPPGSLHLQGHPLGPRPRFARGGWSWRQQGEPGGRGGTTGTQGRDAATHPRRQRGQPRSSSYQPQGAIALMTAIPSRVAGHRHCPRIPLMTPRRPIPATREHTQRARIDPCPNPFLSSWVHEAHELISDAGIGPQFGPRRIGHYRPPLEPRREISTEQT